MRGKHLLVSGLVLIAMLVFASVAFASVYNGSVTFTCLNADASGSGSHVLDRDNTGVGAEELRVDVTDGYGTLIYTLTFSNVLGTFGGGIGDFVYTTPPAANPITFTLTSLAGNGFAEQVDYVSQGSCAGLPTVGGSASCPNPIPSGFAVRSIPAGALAYYEASESAYTGFNLPAGGTWYTGAAENGFVEVWIACQGSNVFVPEGNVVG